MSEDENKDASTALPVRPAISLHGAQTDHPANSLSAASDAIKSSDQSHVGVAQRLADQAIESIEAGLPEAGDQEILETDEGDPNAPASDLVVEDDSADDDSSDEDE